MAVQNDYPRGWTRELTRLFIDPNIFSPPSRGITRNPLDPLPKGSFLEKNERRKLDPYFGFSRKFGSPPCRGKSGSGKDDPSSRPPSEKGAWDQHGATTFPARPKSSPLCPARNPLIFLRVSAHNSQILEPTTHYIFEIVRILECKITIPV